MVDGPSTASIPDEEIVAQQVEALKDSVDSVEGLLDLMIGANVYDRLSVEDKVKYDLFLSYSLTSLYWMYMRTCGENPVNHPVKGEIDRIQDYVKKYQRVKDRKKRPQLQKDAAKRFVKSGLWDPAEAPKPSNKRKKFQENDAEDD